MGSIKQGVLGGFSGKVGTVIGYSMNGISYMRGLATSYTNSKTPAQVAQRAKFALSVKFLRPLLALLRIGFKNASSKMSGFASAMSYTLGNAITGISPAFEIDYTKVLVCRGNLPGALNAQALAIEPGTIDFSWDNNSWDFGAKATDKVVLVVINPLIQKSIAVIGAATRATGNQSVDLPDLFQGAEVQCYIGFTNDTEFSNSEFLDAVNVL